MKLERVSPQSLAATLVVLVILLSGSVYAFSTGGSLAGNAPSPLQDKNTSTSTSTSSDNDNQGGHQDTSTKTTTTSTSRNPSQSHQQTYTYTSTSTHTESKSSTYTSQQQYHELTFRVVPTGTNLGQGEASIQIQGTSLKLDIALENAGGPATYDVVQFSVLAGTPGTTIPTTAPSCGTPPIGKLATDSEGDGRAEFTSSLSPGYYEIGVVLCAGGATGITTTVAYASDPALRPALIGISTTSGDYEAEPLAFELVGTSPATGQAVLGYSGTTIAVYIQVEKAGNGASFGVVLVAIPVTTTTAATGTTSCTSTIGTFVTNAEGNGEAALSKTLSPGVYQLGVVLCTGGSPALVSSPTTRTATLPPTSGEQTVSSTTYSGTQTSTTLTSKTETENNNVNVVTTGQHDEGDIKSAEATKTISAVVSYGNTGVSLHPLDPHFSVSTSPLSNNGLLVSIWAQNVTGSRVLEVNLTGSQWTTASLQGLKVALDGTPIAEAASLSQVLTSTSTDPARYIILVTSVGLQLLVSIPHFSLHTIQILPSVASVLSYLAANGAILVTGLIIFTGFAASLFSKRRKFFALVL